jgi:hypothetical protein
LFYSFYFPVPSISGTGGIEYYLSPAVIDRKMVILHRAVPESFECIIAPVVIRCKRRREIQRYRRIPPALFSISFESISQKY